MPSCVARATEGDAIGRIVSACGMRRPRQKMVGVQSASALAAFSTSEVISLEHGCPKGNVTRVLEVSVSDRTRAALPVPVFRATQMRVARRTTTGATRALSDGRPMFKCQRAPAQGFRDIAPLTRRQRSASCCLPFSSCANLRPRPGSLGRIVPQVHPCGAAGVGAEPESSSWIVASALLTLSRHGAKDN